MKHNRIGLYQPSVRSTLVCGRGSFGFPARTVVAIVVGRDPRRMVRTGHLSGDEAFAELARVRGLS